MRKLLTFFVAAVAIAAGLTVTSNLTALSSGVVISQVYGGGGNTGATFKNDFIELFNRGTTTLSLTGWSVQYAAAGGNFGSSNITPLSGSIPPGGYYLIQEAPGAGGTTNLPAPDATGTIAMAAAAGKVALVNSIAALTGTGCPFAGSVMDFVGYGTGTNCAEGPGPTTTLSNTTAALRGASGCTENDANSTDFTAGAPNPRNSGSAPNTCGNSTNPTGVGSASPATVIVGGSTTLKVTVTAGTNPANSSFTVRADLSSIGGSTTQAFSGGGTVFTFPATVSATTTPGVKSIPATITDGISRTGSASLALTVTAITTSPTAAGSAVPNSLQAGANTLLTVTVTPGTNPPSTGLTVSGNLSPIGGSAAQLFHDDGTNGDATPNDNVFSFATTVSGGTTQGPKSLPIALGDGQSRTGATSISLTVQPPPPPTTVKISQVYGGGGNSGSTYLNDFVEIYNQGPTPVDVSFWSVQYNSAGATTGLWQTTNLCGQGLTCILQPGHYYLVQEAQGAAGTTPLPIADATGVIGLSGTNGKVALVADTVALNGTCPTGGSLVDLVGYGSGNCVEGSATRPLSSTTAAVRKSNGCVDTDNNSADFVTVGPIPRNSASPVNSCGGDPTQSSGVGIASPAAVEPASTTLLTVRVTPATTPPSTAIGVVADATSIAGVAAQRLYDDGTHGDAAAGDGVYSFLATVGQFVQTGVKNIVSVLTDAENRTATAPITMTVASPTCGVERWSVKTGTDPDAGIVDLNNPVPITIAALAAIPAPADPPGPPPNTRVGPTETTVYVVNATMTLYKKEADVDYHVVLDDNAGHLMIAEIPSPACVGSSSPFGTAITAARAKFDARFAATPANEFFQAVSVPVQVKGVGFFDFIHGQTGVAPNGIELHPVLDISFPAASTTVLTSTPNPSSYGQPVVLTATVGNGGASTPTGNVTFFDGTNSIGLGTVLDQNGQAVMSTGAESAGSHTLSAVYQGDAAAAPGTSAPVVQVVNKADQTITLNPITGKTYGDADFSVDASSSSGLPVSLGMTGAASITGARVHINGAGAVTVTASQAGDDNHNPAADATASFDIAQAAQTITFAAPPDKIFGDAPFTATATGGQSGSPVTFVAAGNCASSGLNGSAITITGAGGCSITASQAGNTNYHSAPDVLHTLTVNQAAASITVGGYAGVYDRQAHGASKTAAGVNGEDLSSLVNPGASFTDVPGGTAHWLFAGDANYQPSSGDASIAIARASLITAAADAARAYGANNPILNGLIGGVVEGDNITATYGTSATAASPVGAYAIAPSLVDPDGRLANYSVSSTNGTLTISQAALIVATANASRGYGGANPTFSGTVGGVLNGDNITASFATTATAASPTGSYPITPTLLDPNGRLANYSVSSTNGTLIVGPATLSVAAANAARVYGAANPPLGGTLSGIVNGDNISATYTTSATAGSPVAAYAITPTLNDPDGRLGNYAVATAGGVLSVTPAVLTVAIANAAREYGVANPQFAGTLSGVVPGDGITASFGSSAVPTSPLGTYPIVAMLVDPNGRLSNYSIARGTGVLTVVDTAAPVLSLPTGVTRQALAPTGIAVTYAASAVDNVDGTVSVSCAPASGTVFAVGPTSVACSAHDGRGNTAAGSFAVTVLGDTTAPAITSVTPSVALLWPPNKKMVPVSISVNASDNLGQLPSCRIVSVSSTGGDSADWQITGLLTVNLRAERDDEGAGRAYTITVRCTDAFGNASTGTARVLVLRDHEDDDKDQGKDKDKGKGKDKKG